MRQVGWGSLVLVLLGCSRGDAVSAPDASAPSTTAADGASLVIEELRHRPEFQQQLAPSVQLEKGSAGWKLKPRTGASFRPVGEILDPVLPASANAPLHIGVEGDEDFWIESQSEGVGGSSGEAVAGAVVYRGVARDVDLVHSATMRSVEELRVLRSQAAPTTFRWKLSHGPHVSALRLVNGRIEILDGKSHARIVGEPLFAIDGKGKRVELATKLEGDTLVASLDANGLQYPIHVDPKWTGTGSMSGPRDGAAVVTMASGKVLVAGGSDGATLLSTAEVFDRSAGTNGAFSAVASLPPGGRASLGVLLTDNRVLVAAGSSAYIYDPTANTWTATGALPAAIGYGMRIAQLPSGGALLAYGDDATASPSGRTWHYTAGTNSWSAPTTGTIRGGGSLIPLPSGKVLAVGGGSTAADLYDPTTKTWSSAGTLPSAAGGGTMLPTGKVFVSSGTTMLSYDPTAGTWTTLGTTTFGTHYQQPLLHGKVLGLDGAWAFYLYDTIAKTGAATVTPAQFAYPVQLPSTGELLLAGGWENYTDSEGMPATRATAGAALFSLSGLGETCSAIQDCTKAGSCTDGVCCSAASCGGQCQACDMAGSKGSCVNVTDAPHGSRTPCTAPYLVCKSGACATSCSADTDCVSTAYCTTGGVCAFKKANAATCAANKECTSGNCVDGVCCNSSCGGQCQACDVAGSVGTCTTVPSGQPHGLRTKCAGSGLCAAQCNGSSATACGALPTSTTVCVAASCGGGVETWQSLCDGFGNCPTPTTKSCAPYGCGATACKGSCSSVADCASGYFCSGSTCVTTGGLGTVCSADTDCTSGHCVDNVCCNTGSCTAGLKCNANGLGTCSKPRGTTCTSGAECGSGLCVDGVCCNSSCNGQCEACDVPGSLGTCSPVVGTVHGTRVQCLGSGACKGKCDGSDRTACKAFPGAETVCLSASCASGTETSDARCNGAGTCNAPTTKGCGAYTCGSTACKTTCSGSADCASGYFCSGTTCVTTGALGTACTSSSQCASGNCVDNVCCNTSSCATGLKCNANGAGSCSKPIAGSCSSNSECGSGACADGVCCNNACTGQCEACDVPGSVGTCSAVVGAVHGTTRTACSGTGACQGKCDGSDRTACKSFPAAETICTAAACSAGVETSDARCNGAGGCGTSTSKSCAPYACGASSCKNSCTTSSDCGTGYVCKDFVCKTAGGLGTLCDLTSDCAAGTFCTAGEGTTKVCCAVATCGAGEFCAGTAAGTAKGTCLKGIAATCTGDAQCGSGHCVDGVCCESACDGQCEACDGSGSIGKCVAIKGAPHGSRTACSDGAGDVCRALTCDGADHLKCAAFKSGIDTECKPATCASGVGTDAAYCDGAGKCKESTGKPCSPFVCGDKKCLTSCTKDDDCVKGNVCDTATAQCVTARSSCSPDGLSAVPADKGAAEPCLPYRCDNANGACFKECTTTEQCQTGFACDSKVCKATSGGDTEDSGGCAVSQPGAPGSLAWLAGLGALAFVGRRRRHTAAQKR